MLLHVQAMLTGEQVAQFRRKLDAAERADGKLTAGHQSAKARNNGQLAETDPLARELGALIVDALSRHPLFFAGALPRRIYPQIVRKSVHEWPELWFPCRQRGALRPQRCRAQPIRTDLSATLFLRDPDEYAGGELIVEDTFGNHAIKLPSGDLVLYPGSSLHRVEPVTRGEQGGIVLLDQEFGPFRRAATAAVRTGSVDPAIDGEAARCTRADPADRHLPQPAAGLVRGLTRLTAGRAHHPRCRAMESPQPVARIARRNDRRETDG